MCNPVVTKLLHGTAYSAVPVKKAIAPRLRDGVLRSTPIAEDKAPHGCRGAGLDGGWEPLHGAAQ